jgi:hypothetical protein
MGVFDTIYCEYSLPEHDFLKDILDFQTKSLDPKMTTYTLTADGRLLEHRYIQEPVPEKERPYYGKPEWNREMFRLIGSLRTVETYFHDMEWHGDINFYTPYAGMWYEFTARFTEGKLDSIVFEHDKHIKLPSYKETSSNE